MKTFYSLIVVFACFLLIKADISARIESCSGCSLNRLPDVKKFIFEDVPHYESVEFKHIQGAKPELVLLDDGEKEIDRIPLSSLNRKQCNDLLVEKGFKKTASKEL
ncbi:selenoprotein M-like [Chrysoperla carnea]|uniref:selenoprotein M-like n=1 Tax=Chrysoperla carnea TaxID=189513 RepID=UPI001D08E784|nr:selenoprotein M-like [Chrysoperla carnea]